jgi:hypothetical protein
MPPQRLDAALKRLLHHGILEKVPPGGAREEPLDVSVPHRKYRLTEAGRKLIEKYSARFLFPRGWLTPGERAKKAVEAPARPRIRRRPIEDRVLDLFAERMRRRDPLVVRGSEFTSGNLPLQEVTQAFKELVERGLLRPATPGEKSFYLSSRSPVYALTGEGIVHVAEKFGVQPLEQEKAQAEERERTEPRAPAEEEKAVREERVIREALRVGVARMPSRESLAARVQRIAGEVSLGYRGDPRRKGLAVEYLTQRAHKAVTEREGWQQLNEEKIAETARAAIERFLGLRKLR